MTTPPSTVGIVGLGLMGGSLARDLAKLGVRVLAFDSRLDVARAALDAGVAHGLLDAELRGVREADVVIVATPVDSALAVLSRLAPHLAGETVVSDVGSTKSTIVDHAHAIGIGDRFIGSHPLAGDHRSGWQSARESLYRDATVYLCATPSTTPETTARVADFWGVVGARTVEMEAGEHDRRMAWISHLPQVTASALARAMRAAGRDVGQLGPGGRDMTRLAASSPEMWSAIASANALPIADAILELRAQLETLENALRSGDQSTVDAYFRDARDWVA